MRRPGWALGWLLLAACICVLSWGLSGTRARVVAVPPAGEYVLDGFARMPEGDASYAFRLVVEG